MGDRANFGFRQGEDVLYLYGAWAGQGMMGKLAKALARVPETLLINDEAYATRICISDLTARDHESNLGWGITINGIGDNEHTIPVVDFQKGTVGLYDWDFAGVIAKDPKVTFSISKFINKYSKVDA